MCGERSRILRSRFSLAFAIPPTRSLVRASPPTVGHRRRVIGAVRKRALQTNQAAVAAARTCGKHFLSVREHLDFARSPSTAKYELHVAIRLVASPERRLDVMLTSVVDRSARLRFATCRPSPSGLSARLLQRRRRWSVSLARATLAIFVGFIQTTRSRPFRSSSYDPH